MAETVRKNLGMVTAYAYAVSKGYSGTEEEFAELMASYADVAQDAEASAQAAAQSATTAEQKATQAAGSATNAAGSATSASESAQAAAGSSNSASLYAQNASASATNAAGSASSASTHAGNASASAQAAEGSANAAQESATTATAKAGEAATSATTAVEAAQRAEDAATTLVIDDTLTHAGQAADAKKTGDEIGELKEDFNDLKSALDINSGALGAERTYTGTTSTTGSDVTFASMFLAKDHTYTFSATLSASYGHNVYFKVFQKGTANRLLQLNLVNGATTGHGKITATADMGVELKMYISSATETSISVTVIDQDGIATDVKQIAFNISPLSDSVFKFNDYFTFKNGGIRQGGWVSSTPYRVMCDTIMRFDFDITLQIENGFKCGVHTFVNGSFASDSGWKTGTYKIVAGTYFKVVIARYAEVLSETADVDLFASMITVVANDALATNAKISTLTDDLLTGSRVVALPAWEQGGILGNNGQIATSANDIRSTYAVHIPAGEYWINPNGVKLYYFYYSAIGEYIENCTVDRTWGMTNAFKISFASDKYIKFVQARTNGITPTEATLQITQVIPKTPIEFQHYKNGITIMSKAGEGLGVPPQSLISVKEAFKNLYDGYRINVCKTSDGYYVCSHDRSINSIARNSDNTQISATINIDEHTLAELNQYDYGIQYGVAFAGTKITLFSDTVALCAKLGLKLDIEWKYPEMTETDVEAVYDAIVTNGYSNKNWHWIAKNTIEVGYFKNVCDYVDIEVLVSSASVNYYLPLINEAKSDNHDVIVGYSDGNYNEENIIKLRKLNVIQNRGIATNLSQMIAQIESGVTELECNFYNPKQAMIDYALSN